MQAANYATNMVLIPGHIRTLGFGKDSITLSVSLFGAAEIVARAFFGWFADLNVLSRIHIFMMCSLVSGVIAFIIPHLPYLTALLTYSVLVGIFCGSFGSLMGVLMVDAVGLENYSPAFGLLALGCGFSFCLNQPIVGWLEDVTGSWDMSFRYAGILGLLAFLLLLIEPFMERIWCIDYTGIAKHPADVVLKTEINCEEIGLTSGEPTTGTMQNRHPLDDDSFIIKKKEILTENYN